MTLEGRAGHAHKQTVPFGSWQSPLSAHDVAGHSLRLGMVQSDADWIYWSEGRPQERGRVTIVRANRQGELQELLAAPFSARSRVHEYGGGEFILAGGVVYFVNDADQDIYRLDLGEGAAPERITAAPNLRFADLWLDAGRERLIAVAERHRNGEQHPDNLLTAVSLRRETIGSVGTLVEGADFYAYPRVSADGARVCWLQWMLPDMPWDQAELWLADLHPSGRPMDARRIAGGDGVAACEPQWMPDGGLLFLLDSTGWSNLYRWMPDGTVRALAPADADFGRPLWALGTSSYAQLDDGRIACSFIGRGETRLGVLDIGAGSMSRLKSDLRGFDHVVATRQGIAGLATCDTAAPAIVAVHTDGDVTAIRSSASVELAPATISIGRVIEFGSPREPVYAIYYAPTNERFTAPAGHMPPAMLLAHGGPTGSADRGLKLKIQFWTSRGFAVCDVDYSGSTGYGRAYRERLDAQWGVRDVADMVAAGEHLARNGLADPARLVISGSSAGGYTVLMTLASSQAFAAGTCYYGISDLGLLLEHTHKFESGYLHRLMGTTPERWQEVFKSRSPIELAGQMRTPLAIFQGLEDKVVPPEQSRLIHAKLEALGIDTEYWEFEGEGHGFRRAETIASALERELAFLSRVLSLRGCQMG